MTAGINQELNDTTPIVNKDTELNLSTDTISKTDELGRKKFGSEIAKNILQYIKSNNESLVIGLHGSWGSGKSTLLNFIKENLKTDITFANARESEKKESIAKRLFRGTPGSPKKKLFILEFNPWMFSGKEQLHRVFLNEFALKVKSKKHSLRTKIELFSKRLQWVGDVHGIGAAAHKGISGFSEISIEKLKDETNKILRDEDIHVVVMIDDVDRLAPTEMLEVFQLVRLNANFNNTLFLISFDKKIVSQSIFNQFNFDGENYLEKIIQVDYSLPSIPSEQMESMFFNRLMNLFKDENRIDISSLTASWLIHGLRFYFNNIRDLNRYFNSVSFRLPAIQNDVNIHDFLLIEAIRLFDFKSYEIIRENYKESLQHGPGSSFTEKLNGLTALGTRQLYEYLFDPLKAKSFSLNDFRVYETDFFDRYFTLVISKKDIREEEFNSFILHPPSRLNQLITIIRSNKIDFLLRRIIAKADSLNKNDSLTIISPLLTAWGDFQEGFSVHWRTVWGALKAIAKTAPDANVGYQKVLDEILVASSNFSPARFTFLWLVLENIYKEDERNIDPDLAQHYEFFKANQERIERHFIHLLEIQRGTFLFDTPYNDLYQRIFLLSYSRLSSNKYEEYLKQMILIEDSRILSILDKVMYRDVSSGKIIGINIPYIQRLIPGNLRNEISMKLKTINPNSLSGKYPELLKYSLENIFNE